MAERFEDKLRTRRPMFRVNGDRDAVCGIYDWERDALADAVEAARTVLSEISTAAAREAYAADLGASEWDAFVSEPVRNLDEALARLDGAQ